MIQEFIPYQQALELKKLGFDEPCLGYYTIYSDGEVKLFTSDKGFRNLEAPTFSQAFRFFREKYGYLVSPFQNENNLFFFEIGKLNTLKTEHYSKDWETYEDAEISCLVKLIEIIKNK